MDPTAAPFVSAKSPSSPSAEDISWIVEHIMKNLGMPSRGDIVKLAQILTTPSGDWKYSLFSLVLSGRPLWFVLELWEAPGVPFVKRDTIKRLIKKECSSSRNSLSRILDSWKRFRAVSPIFDNVALPRERPSIPQILKQCISQITLTHSDLEKKVLQGVTNAIHHYVLDFFNDKVFRHLYVSKQEFLRSAPQPSNTCNPAAMTILKDKNGPNGPSYRMEWEHVGGAGLILAEAEKRLRQAQELRSLAGLLGKYPGYLKAAYNESDIPDPSHLSQQLVDDAQTPHEAPQHYFSFVHAAFVPCDWCFELFQFALGHKVTGLPTSHLEKAEQGFRLVYATDGTRVPRITDQNTQIISKRVGKHLHEELPSSTDEQEWLESFMIVIHELKQNPMFSNIGPSLQHAGESGAGVKGSTTVTWRWPIHVSMLDDDGFRRTKSL